VLVRTPILPIIFWILSITLTAARESLLRLSVAGKEAEGSIFPVSLSIISDAVLTTGSWHWCSIVDVDVVAFSWLLDVMTTTLL
jgi:hypothetical protein